MSLIISALLIQGSLAMPQGDYGQTNLLQNPGFDATDICKLPQCSNLQQDGWCTLPVSNIAPWYLSDTAETSVDIVNSPKFPVQTGKNSIDLNTLSPIKVNQDLELKPGQYQLVFGINMNSYCGLSSANGCVKVVGADQCKPVSEGFTVTPGMQYQDKTYTFSVKTCQKYTITIGSDTQGHCGPILDNVRLYKTSDY